MEQIPPRKGARPPIVIAALIATVALVAVAVPADAVTTAKLAKQIKQIKAQIAAIQKQQGPPGAPGSPGAAGTARAYGTVDDDSCVPGTPDVCSATKAKGISSVTRDGVNYCVKAAGIDPTATSVAVSVDYDSTDTAEGDAQVMLGGVATNCADGFRVRTARTGATAANSAQDIAFTIVIP